MPLATGSRARHDRDLPRQPLLGPQRLPHAHGSLPGRKAPLSGCDQVARWGRDRTSKTRSEIRKPPPAPGGGRRISDIIHSQAIAAAGWNGINTLVGPNAAFSGLPGAGDIGTFQRQHIADVKAKEMRLMTTLVLNQWDRLLAVGNASNNTLEFDGIETQVVTGNGAHVRSAPALQASGTFAASSFDQFLSEACAKPTDVFGHPQAIQEAMSSYFQLWGAGTQVINFTSGERMTPGYNFSSEVRTGVGILGVHVDANFTRTASGASSFMSSLYPLRMVHNGEPLVYKITQIPLAFKDLAPLCTAVQFMIWAKTALTIKAMCAQSRYQSIFSGRLVTSCPTVY